MPGKCCFNELWLEMPEYKEWLRKCPENKSKAKCSFCTKTIDLSNMGEAAVKTHMTGKKHKELTAVKKTNSYISLFVKQQSSNILKDTQPETSSKAELANLNERSSLSNFLVNSDVQSAEILWALKSVKSHYSYKSSEDIGKLFATMFPDSKIASKFSCGEKKLAYICCFGLAPHFQNILAKCFDECEYFTVLFDETLNVKREEKQMDIHVRFWHKELNEVCTRYFTSVLFMGHATSENILDAFLASTNQLTLSKMMQVSMDGPAVNWAFYDKLQNHVKRSYGVEVLNVGSCGLHILNNAFKHGESMTSWDVSSFLSALYYLFTDCPARREDFLKMSQCKKFPLKFVNHRWLENAPCAERALEIWHDVKRFVENVKKGTIKFNPPKSYFIVEKAIKDNLMPLKISFFASISNFLQPFLTLYQSEKPLLPFLATDVLNLVKQCILIYNILKSEVVRDMTILKLCKFDFSDESNFMPLNDISSGFSTDKLLNELKREKQVTEKEVLVFKCECRKFVIEMVKRLMLKMPVNYAAVRNLVCLDPRLMATKELMCITKMQKLFEKLNELNRFPSDACEKALQQYRTFLNTEVKQNFSDFSNYIVSEMRLDTFLHKYMSKENYSDLWRAVKSLLILSHGQAAVERGFSVNKKIEVENLKIHSYISQKLIYDHIQFCGGIFKVQITKDLKDSVSAARQRYMQFLKDENDKKKNSELSRKRKDMENELNSLKVKMQKTENDIQELEKSAEDFATKGELMRDLKSFIKSNNMRKIIKEKSELLSEIKNEIEIKTTNLKN